MEEAELQQHLDDFDYFQCEHIINILRGSVLGNTFGSQMQVLKQLILNILNELAHVIFIVERAFIIIMVLMVQVHLLVSLTMNFELFLC
jgi:hypothetical protein